MLSNYASERDPIIIMKDVTFAEVKCLIEFMYKGEINVEHVSSPVAFLPSLILYLLTCIPSVFTGQSTLVAEDRR